MTRALIIGANGFTGTHLARYLKRMQLEIHGADIARTEVGRRGRSNDIDFFYNGDVRDRAFVSEVIRSANPDYLFHLAGKIKSDNLEELLDTNVMGTKNVLDATPGMTTRILLPGSAAEYGAVAAERQPITETAVLRPVTLYGISKVCQTMIGCCYYHARGCQVYVARPFNMIGPGAPEHLVCSSLARQICAIKNGSKAAVLELGDQDGIRDFIDVRDVVRAYWAVVNKGTAGEIYNVCSGKGRSIREMVDAFRSAAGVTFDVREDKSRSRETDVSMSVGSNDKITRDTGWRPEFPLTDSLRSMVEFYSKAR
jgi:GDP-4-dehydro-6-deoxy-D-mannose reductase